MSLDPSGDFQTPRALADAVIERLLRDHPAPDVVVEPTCGKGTFLAAVADRIEARLIGFERNPEHAAAASSAIAGARIEVRDAFSLDWSTELAGLQGRIWIVGNPPWVTASALGRTVHDQGPARVNPGLKGLEAMTGAANFDLSEWLWLRLVEALAGREDALLALLCKTHTARRVLPSCTPIGLYRIDARKQFGVSAAAGLMVGRPGPTGDCRVYRTLRSVTHDAVWRVVDGVVSAGTDDGELLGEMEPAWRSGVKHDCARVLELVRTDGVWRNGLGEAVDVEPDRIAPYLKASDLHRGSGPERGLVLCQKGLNDTPDVLAAEAPKALAYLERHGAALDGRRSSIWKARPRFALFGIGPYSFAPWKVAVSALRSELHFRVVGPREGSPVLVDDTSYFLPLEDEAVARDLCARLGDPRARAFLEARSFSGSKRKITRKVLQQLDLWQVGG